MLISLPLGGVELGMIFQILLLNFLSIAYLLLFIITCTKNSCTLLKKHVVGMKCL